MEFLKKFDKFRAYKKPQEKSCGLCSFHLISEYVQIKLSTVLMSP